MKTFADACVAYHAACEAICEHQGAEMAVDIRSKKHLEKFSAYSDLTYWPESPLLEGIGDAEKAELVAWGDQYAEQLKVFHAKTETLLKARFEALCNGLHSLGYETGKAYREAVGAFDERVQGLLAKADQRRKVELDGIGYVCVREEGSNFGKGFYKASGLKRTQMFADLKLCAQIRELKGPAQKYGDIVRLGFAEEVGDESR